MNGTHIYQTRRADLARRLIIVSLVCAMPMALMSMLLVFPAPFYFLWVVAAVAGELAGWMLLVGLLGGICGLASYCLGKRGTIIVVANSLCLFVIAVTGSYSIQAHRVAIEQGVPLSWNECPIGISDKAASINELHDIVFVKPDGHSLRLDIYEGVANAKPNPGIIVVHGGSWKAGQKGDFSQWSRWLAAEGYTVCDIEYRLADRNHPFPTQLTDVRTAIVWLHQHAREYNVDPKRIALMGRSAGAQLALLAAYTPVISDHKGDPLPIRCVISLYGPTDLVWDFDNPAHPDVIHAQAVLKNYLAGSPDKVSENYSAASPSQHVSINSVPSLFIHGGRDQVVRRENMGFMIPKLQAAHIPVESLYLPWANHGFDWNFNGWSSQISRYRIVKFLAKYL